MAPDNTPSSVRQQIARLSGQRERLETKLLSARRKMLNACLIARGELAGGKRRHRPAFYLSEKVDGKTKLTYVRKDQVVSIRLLTDRWREFSCALAEWVKVTGQIEKLFRELGKHLLTQKGG